MQSGTLWRHQKQAMGMKKWVKNSATLTRATQLQPATLILTDKDKKAQYIKLSNACRIEAMQAQYKNRDHAFEIVCVEEKQHFLAAETSEDLNRWLIKLHDAAGLRKDHLFGDCGAGCGGGGGGLCVSGSGGGGGGGGSGPPTFENFGLASPMDGDNELQDNLLYDSYDNKTFPVSIRENPFTDSLNLHGAYTLQLDSMKISLIDINTAKILFSWPYRYLRRYGREKNSFSMEVGRRCLSGEGLIRFNVADGNQVFSAIQAYVSAMTGRTGAVTPTSVPQAPPSFNANLSPVSESSQKVIPAKPSRPGGGVKVLPAGLPRDRTHSAGSRNIPPKPANHPQLPSRGAQSVDDITSGVSTRNNAPDQFYSAVSDEAVDRSKLPSPKTQRAQKADFEPELHYDIASDPPPKQWPQVSSRRDKSTNGKNLTAKPKPNPRTHSVNYTNVDKSAHKGETVLSDATPASIDKGGGGNDPGVYSCLEQPPGSVIVASGGDGSQVHAEADDSDHIYDHLARGKVSETGPTPRLPPSTTKQAMSGGGKGHPVEGGDMIYDHLNRGQASASAPSNNGAAGLALEDAYDTLSLDSAQPSPLPGDATSYLVSSYPSSTVPEESEYAEANANKYYYDENPYEVAEDQ